MRLLIRIFLWLVWMAPALASHGQEINQTCTKQYSLLTCSPGSELYSTFGHSALRVVDTVSGMDYVFNWGTFDFSDPDFYTKFVRGKLLYYLNVESFGDFMLGYRYEQRSVYEQVLQLSCAEKTELDQLLRENLKTENRYYKYDFCYDNCTTRLRELIAKATQPPYPVPAILPAGEPSFRTLIHQYLDAGNQPWSKLGIDLLLGMPLDQKLDHRTAQFLPDYLLKALDSTQRNEETGSGVQRLVAEKKTLYQATEATPQGSGITPLGVFSILALLVMALSFFAKTPRAQKILNGIDFSWLFLSGALGFLFIFMWLFTDHQACRNNLNLLWAYPPNLLVAFLFWKPWKTVRLHFGFLIGLYSLLLLSWWILPQALNPALIPFVVLMLVRAWKRWRADKQPSAYMIENS